MVDGCAIQINAKIFIETDSFAQTLIFAHMFALRANEKLSERNLCRAVFNEPNKSQMPLNGATKIETHANDFYQSIQTQMDEPFQNHSLKSLHNRQYNLLATHNKRKQIKINMVRNNNIYCHPISHIQADNVCTFI